MKVEEAKRIVRERAERVRQEAEKERLKWRMPTREEIQDARDRCFWRKVRRIASL